MIASNFLVFEENKTAQIFIDELLMMSHLHVFGAEVLELGRGWCVGGTLYWSEISQSEFLLWPTNNFKVIYIVDTTKRPKEKKITYEPHQNFR